MPAPPAPLSPYTIIVATISAGGADEITHVALPDKTRLVTIFPVANDAFITDRGAALETADDAHQYPLLANGHNEFTVDGWGEGGAVLRLGSATPSTKVRILCQR